MNDIGKHPLPKPLDVTIEYRAATGAPTRRKISIQSVMNEDGTLYLTAYCHERRAPRDFRLDRITAVLSEHGEVLPAAALLGRIPEIEAARSAPSAPRRPSPNRRNPPPPPVAPTTDDLTGQKIVFTGQLVTLGRNEAVAMAQAAGAEQLGAVSEEVTLLVVGFDPSARKVTAARKLGIPIADEEAFRRMLGFKD